MLLSDQHIHSDNSPDGKCSVIELCESAVQKKLRCISITDHCEVDLFYKDRYNIGYRQSFYEAKKAAYVFGNQLTVNVGVELGQATADLSICENVLSLPYDIVIGSMHAVPGMQDFYFLDYKTIDVKKLFSQYLSELKKLAVFGNFDTLAHMTYPLRYINGVNGCNLNTEDFGDEIEAVFKEIIKRGISLEINTSGLRQEINDFLPNRFCLTLYKSLGGERLTIGSDAHNKEEVGKNIREAIEFAKEIGFTYYCIYRKRKPESVKI